MVVGESDFSTADMERVQQTGMELGSMNGEVEQDQHTTSAELGPSESDMESGLVGLRQSGCGMGWGQEEMGMGTMEGVGSGQVERSPRDSLLDVSACSLACVIYKHHECM